MRLTSIAAMGLALAMAATGAVAQSNTTTMDPLPNQLPGDPVLRPQSTTPIAEDPRVPGDPALVANTLVGVSSNEVFDAHDTDGDGMLNKDEFGRALHFNPVFDCVDPSTQIDDPRCARWRSIRGR